MKNRCAAEAELGVHCRMQSGPRLANGAVGLKRFMAGAGTDKMSSDLDRLAAQLREENREFLD